MSNRSHVAIRASRSSERAFPARPTLPFDRACAGAAIILEPGAPTPDLRPLRDLVDGLWRGPLEEAPGSPDIVVVSFVSPTRIDALLPPTTLPLIPSPAGALVSFIQAGATETGAHGRGDGAVRRVELWWGGREHRIALDALRSISVASLWDVPRLDIHPPTPRVAERAVEKPSEPDGLAKVGRARIPIRGDARNPIDDVEAKVRDLEERTKLRSILGQIFGRRGVGAEGSGGEGASARRGGAAAGPEPQPGVLENLAGWVRWHTPLGAGLRSRLKDRLNLVEKLISSGDLDSALKLALSLGAGAGQGQQPKRYLNDLPGARSLDLSYQGGGYSSPILGGDAFASLQTRYAALAQRLERDGDFRRAAYIHAQLLNNPRQAALTLEAGQLFREAARLALDAKLEPSLTIRLLFKAGELDAALALAKRAACFEQLAEESRNKDAGFHAYVITAWTEMLIATDQPLRALQVTDQLAMRRDGQADLLAAREGWLNSALAQAALAGGFDAELAARGLLMGCWSKASAADLRDFPHAPLTTGAGPSPALLDWFRTVLRDEVETAPLILIDLLQALARFAGPDQQEQASFWSGPARSLLEAFARSLLDIASNRLGPKELETLHLLLEQADLTVLAADIGKLGKLHVQPAPAARSWHVPAPSTTRPAVRVACILGGGQLLIWRDSRVLQLLDRHGGVLWQQGLSDLTALVPVGAGSNVIVVQSQRDGSRLLTRFASHERAFHPIGKVRLSAHHDVTSETQWLVQIGGEIGALDLVKLCAPSPEIEFLWSAALTERVQAIAFGHSAQSVSWLTYDVSPARAGVRELWTMHSTGRQSNFVCQPPSRSDVHASEWIWAVEPWSNRIVSGPDRTPIPVLPWTIELERQAVKTAAEQAFDGAVAIQTCDFGRPFIQFEPTGATPTDAPTGLRTRIMEPDGQKVGFTFEHEPDVQLTCLARAPTPLPSPTSSKGRAVPSMGRPVLLGDEAGRLFILDLTTLNLSVV
jgi:hypothetical protein